MIKQHNYTFHAYKPDSSDICMGCLMASYSSDEIFEYELDEDGVIDTWSTVLSTSLDTGERGYEDIHLLQNGILLRPGDPDYDRLFALATKEAAEIVALREEEAMRAKEAEDRRKNEEREARERKELSRLRAKYESNRLPE